MKTSTMDKIRILRSNRRKTDPKKGQTVSPAPVVATACPPPPVAPEAPQQWVPVLVLDISQANTSPATTNIPVTYNNNVQNIAVKKSILVKKSIPVTACPTQGDSLVTGTNVSLRCTKPDPKHTVATPSEAAVDPASSGPSCPAVPKSSEQTEKPELDCSDNPVKCVLCDKSFPSLKDMQTHYLSTHKSRRAKDGRKAKTSAENLGTQAVDNEQASPDQEKGEPVLPVGDKGEVDPKCPVCCIDFTTAEEVKTHMKEVHSYVCSECSSTFYSLFQFTNHKCTKVTKKVKRVRKKTCAGVTTKLPLRPEVAKIMNRFVQIQPKTKKNSKASHKSQRSPSPPPLESVQQPPPMIAVVGDADQPHVTETVNEGNFPLCGIATSTVTESTPSEPMKETKQAALEEEESHFLPSIATTYSLKSCDDTSSDSQSNRRVIPVLDTRNLEQAKKLFRNMDAYEAKVPKNELIRQKIAQLKRNPNVSLSWRPTLRVRGQVEEDGEFVCGRCNVLCDDMEDYMDHLHDCLTMTSVTLEPAPTPPRRLLRLPCQTAAFGSRETNSNRYLINQSLIAKLRAFLPHPLNQVNSLPQHFKIPATTPPNSLGQTFRDLLDDDFGYESHESIDQQTVGSASPVSPATRQSEVVHSPRDTMASQGGAGQGRVCVSGTTKGVAQPMVMIPVDSKAKIHLSVVPDHQLLKRPGQCLAGEDMVPACSSPSLAASPLGLLLDQEDIKMEVEEEVIEDHFEDS